MADIDIYKAKLPQDDTNLYRFRDGVIEPLVDTSYEETDYANPLTFETLQAQTAKNTKIKIEPIQDLHGYDKPWVGGAGKNKLGLLLSNIKALNTAGTWNENEYTNHGMTAKFIERDGYLERIECSGTNTAVTALILYSNSTGITPDNYIFSGCPSGGSSLTYRFIIKNVAGASETGVQVYESGSGLSLDNTYTIKRIVFNVYANTNMSGKVVYPMLRLATETDATFAPYENICPISGRTEIGILGEGKNLFNIGLRQGGFNNGYPENNSRIRVSSNNFISAIAGGTYTITASTNESGRALKVLALFWETDDYSTFISNSGSFSEVPYTFTVPSNAHVCQIDFGYINDFDILPTEIYNVQLEQGTSATPYEPYQSSNDLTISLGQTVYGGTLDVENGVLVVDRGYKKGSALNLNYNAQYNVAYAYLNNPAKKVGLTNLISSYYKTVAKNYRDMLNGEIAGTDSDNGINIKDDSCNSLETYQTKLTDMDLVYELATPFTLYISPEHLKLLKSQNNLTTSQYTQVKVTYRNGVFATLEELSDTAQDIYDEISGDATTISGNPINFTTREKQKSKSTIIDLEPIQDLHGFTKPWVGGAGKNLLPMMVDDLKTVNSSRTWTGNSCDVNGVTVTILTDNAGNVTGFNFNGNCSLSSSFYIINGTRTTNDSGLILNGITGGGTSTYRLRVNGEYIDTGSGVTIPANTNITQVDIRMNSGTTLSNIKIYPMIRLSTESDATFAPYTNICPISGRLSVDIDGCGKNLISEMMLGKVWYGSDGTLNNGSRYLASQKFKVNGNQSYSISVGYLGDRNHEDAILFWDKDENYLGTNTVISITSNMQTFLTPVNAKYCAIDLGQYLNPSETVYQYAMVEKGNQSTAYEPYTPSTDLTISFGTTVYGGRLDVEKGMLTITDGKKKVSDLTWSNADSAGIKRFKASVSDIFVTGVTRTLSELYCKQYETISDGRNFSECPLYCIYTDNVSGLFIEDQRYTDASDFSTNEANTEVVYKLATPQTIQLTPQQVQLLKGINNISTTGTTITVTFKNGSVAHLDDLPENVFTDLDKEKLASIDTLAVTLDLLTHTLIVTQDV